MGNAYDFPLLTALAKSKFVVAMHAPEFSLQDLVSAIDIVYATTPDENDGLRKHMVYLAQTCMQEIKKLDSFKTVYEKYIGFCWAFAFEYGARKTVRCANCETKSKIPTNCTCGFHDLCGTSKACNDSSWVALRCSVCKKIGSRIRVMPDADDDVSIVGGGKRRGLPASSMGTRSAKKTKTTL